jgi:hypothetical protein
MKPEKICACGCGLPIEARRSPRKYLDNSHRQRAYRTRRASQKSFELVNIRKKVAGDLMRSGLISEDDAWANYYAPSPAVPAPAARNRNAPESVEAYQQRIQRGADFWKLKSGVFDSETVSPNRQRISGVSSRRGSGSSKPPPGVNQKANLESLTVTHTMGRSTKKTMPIQTPTIVERVTKLEMDFERQKNQIAELAVQVGLSFNDDEVQEAVVRFLKTALN